MIFHKMPCGILSFTHSINDKTSAGGHCFKTTSWPMILVSDSRKAHKERLPREPFREITHQPKAKIDSSVYGIIATDGSQNMSL